MEIILSLIVNFIITAFSYMCIPVYLILYAKKRYEPKEAFRVALINSIIVKILLMIFSSLLGNEEINIYPAIFWGTVNLYFQPELKETLHIWDSQIVSFGSKIIERRKLFAEQLNDIINELEKENSKK